MSPSQTTDQKRQGEAYCVWRGYQLVDVPPVIDQAIFGAVQAQVCRRDGPAAQAAL
jgi:hypothetical protein